MRRKVALAFAVILLVAMGPSVAAVWGLSAVHRAAAEVREAWLPAARLLGEVGRAYARLRISDTRTAVSTDPAIVARGRQIATGNLEALQDSLRAYELLPLPSAERQAVAERAATLQDYTRIRVTVAHLADAGHMTEARDLWFGEANLKFRTYNDLLDTSIARMASLADAATRGGETIYRISLWLLLGGAVIAVAAAIGTELALVYLIARPITHMVERLHRLAEGDLSIDTPETLGADEVGAMGRALQVFKHNAAQMVRRELDLRKANAQFDAALTNMSQGLCMYDSAGRLAVVNARYAEIFRLPANEVRLGVTRREVIKLRATHGNHGDAATATLLKMLEEGQSRDSTRTWTMDASGGRTVEASNCPIADGGWVTTYTDVTERRRAEEQVVFLARHDPLTRLPNRTLFQERVEQELAHVGRGSKAAILCLDLDRFKAINDTFGHPVGDMLLRVVAERLTAAVREVDMVARLGGEVGLERPEDIAKLANRIVDLLSAPYQLDGHEVIIGASLGVALAPTDGTYFDKLLKCADMALYRVKLVGKAVFASLSRRWMSNSRLATPWNRICAMPWPPRNSSYSISLW
jgi:diguanylate cyclase (GGDEF)-like protein